MPNAVVTSWDNGPMGGGFFIFFPADVDVWYDGGSLEELFGERDDERRRESELLGLVLLMGEQ